MDNSCTLVGIVVTPIQFLNMYELWKLEYPRHSCVVIIDPDSSGPSKRQIFSTIKYLNDPVKVNVPDESFSQHGLFVWLKKWLWIYGIFKEGDCLVFGNWTNTRCNIISTIFRNKTSWYVDDGLNSLMYPILPTRGMLGDDVYFLRELINSVKRNFCTFFLRPQKRRFFSLYPIQIGFCKKNNYWFLKKKFSLGVFSLSKRVLFLGGPYVSTGAVSSNVYFEILQKFVCWAGREFPDCIVEYHAHRREAIEVDMAKMVFDNVVVDKDLPVELRLIQARESVVGIFSNESSAVFTCKQFGLCEQAGIVSLKNVRLFQRHTEYLSIFSQRLDETLKKSDSVEKIILGSGRV